MQVAKKVYDQAVAVAKQHSVSAVFVNEKSEFFLNENLAALSVGGDKEKYTKLEIDNVTAAPKAVASPYEGMSVTDLKTELDTRTIAYDAKANKATLTGLLTADDAAKADA